MYSVKVELCDLDLYSLLHIKEMLTGKDHPEEWLMLAYCRTTMTTITIMESKDSSPLMTAEAEA